MVTFGYGELAGKPELGTEIRCPHCGQLHPVEYGDSIGPDGKPTGKKCKVLAFYTCDHKSYVCGIDGKSIMAPPPPPLSPTRMYILVKSGLAQGMAMVAAAHASLACYLTFKDTEAMRDWQEHSFKKVVCMVNDSEFAAAKEHPDHVLLTESSMGNAETALAFCPRQDWPRAFKFYKLWR